MLQLSFDELYAPSRNYAYELVHCNWDWTPSNLAPAQYLNGFPVNYIEQFRPSFNTYVPYTHYKLEVPNNNVDFRLPGNYLLKIYENDPDDPILVRRLVVFQQKVDIDQRLHPATLARYYRSHHEVDFSLDYKQLNVQDPFSDVQAVILQNHRWAFARKGLRPTSIRGSRLIYDYERENLFPGGNEFRALDIRSAQSPGRGTAASRLDSVFFIFTDRDEPRRQYTLQFDNNGNSLILTRDRQDPHTQGDYAWVEFILEDPSVVQGADDVYVYGMFNNWQLQEANRMVFNSQDYTFRKRILIKQGYHDYKYTVRKGDGRLMDNLISGSFADTENNYEIIVYIRSLQLNVFLPYGYLKFSSESL